MHLLPTHLTITGVPRFKDYVNYLVGGVILYYFEYNKKNKFLHDCRLYIWDDPFIYNKGIDGLIQRWGWGIRTTWTVFEQVNNSVM